MIMLEVIKRILIDYGDEILGNMHRTHAILLDLAPAAELKRERILVRNFIEMDGYGALKNASADYPMLEKKLTQVMIDTFAVEKQAAAWAVRVFAAALGLLQDSEVVPLLEINEASEKLMARLADGYLQGQVSIGRSHVVAVSTDGSVFAAGGNDHFECDVSGWQNIVAVAARDSHTLGLRQDGTVLAAGSNAFDQCDVSHFSDVKAVYAFGNDSICVLKDGTAVSAGRSKLNLSEFSDIKSIAPYPEGVIGVRTDGSLTLAGYVTEDEMANEIAWLLNCTDVEQVISTHINGSIILGKDSRIYKSNQPENYFAQWRDIKSIVNLADGFAILNKDGTVRVLPYERGLPRIVTDADNWRDIEEIYGGYKRLIGLTKDGNLKVAYTHMGWLWGNKAMEMDYVLNWFPVGVGE